MSDLRRACPLAAVGAMIGPTSAGNWQRLLVRHSLTWVVAVVAAIHTDTRQPVNAAEAERVLDRLERQRVVTGTATIRLTDLAKAIIPATSTQPMSTRAVSTAPASSTPAAVQACGTTTAAGSCPTASWVSAEQVPARVIAAIQHRKIGRSVAAAEMGMSPYTLIRLLEGVNTRGIHFTTLNKLLAWLEKQPTSLATAHG